MCDLILKNNRTIIFNYCKREKSYNNIRIDKAIHFIIRNLEGT